MKRRWMSPAAKCCLLYDISLCTVSGLTTVIGTSKTAPFSGQLESYALILKQKDICYNKLLFKKKYIILPSVMNSR